MKTKLNYIRKNWFLLIIFVGVLLSFLSLQPLDTNRLDSGKVDTISQYSQLTGKSRRRRRLRKFIIWRYVITLISRNRDQGLLFPRIRFEKLSESSAFQQFTRKLARRKKQHLRARIRKFDDYLQAHNEEIKQLIEQYDEKITKIKSGLSIHAKVKNRWQTLKLELVFQYQRLRDLRRELRMAVGILCISLIILMLTIMTNQDGFAFVSGPLAAGSIFLGSSIIRDNHKKYKAVTEKLAGSGYQPLLDYGWLVESNPSVLYPTVLDNVDWSLFNNLAQKYRRQYSHFLAQERKKAKINKPQKLGQAASQINFLSLLSPLKPGERFNAETCPLELAEDELAELERLSDKKNGGRRFEHNFMPLFKAFVILRFMDIKPSVANVIRSLCGNPYLLVKLQFKDNQLPSYRVIYRFDQVMSRYGLWNEAFDLKLLANIKQGVINPEKEKFLGQDTTHIEACATKGKKKKKCADCVYLAECRQPQATDNTAGTLVKKQTEHHHAHKVALANLLHSELCLGFKVFKGNTNDAKTFSPLLKMFKQKFPEFNFTHILVDGIYDEADCYETAKSCYPQAKLVPSRMNPRNRKDKSIKSRGIVLVNKRGQAVCINRQKMVFVSRDLQNQHYIWGCPFYHPDVTTDKPFTAKEKYRIIEKYKYSRDLNATAKKHGITPKVLKTWVSRMRCAKDKELDPKGMLGLEDECPLKDECCPNARQGRIFRTKAEEYPFVDWDLPQFSYQRRVLVALRLANERIISRLKENLSGDKLFKQNDFNVEAHIAKSLLAQHIFAAVAFSLERPEAIRRIKTFHSMFQKAA